MCLISIHKIKLMKTFLKILVATIIGLNAGIVAIAFDATDTAVFAVTITASIVVSVLVGVFDIPDKTETTAIHKRMKRHDSTNDMQEAA